jgi:hypothetical protein
VIRIGTKSGMQLSAGISEIQAAKVRADFATLMFQEPLEPPRTAGLSSLRKGQNGSDPHKTEYALHTALLKRVLFCPEGIVRVELV